jgi:hypothetical protein
MSDLNGSLSHTVHNILAYIEQIHRGQPAVLDVALGEDRVKPRTLPLSIVDLNEYVARRMTIKI